MVLHLNLEHVIFFDAVFLEVWQTRILDYDTSCHVVGNGVRVDLGDGVLLGQEPRGVVVHDLVLLDDTVRINQDDSVKVILDDILVNQKLVFSLDDEDTLTL